MKSKNFYSKWKKALSYILSVEVKSIGHCVRDMILWCLPNNWCTDRFLRPLVLKLFGMQCGSRTTIGKGQYYGSLGNIKIGERVMVNRNVLFHAGDKISIGNSVGIGFNVSFITGDHEVGPAEHRCGRLVRKNITIEDGVWIAARAFIGPGVTIGAGSVVSAGAVVMRSMPPNSLIAGNPARVIRKLQE